MKLFPNLKRLFSGRFPMSFGRCPRCGSTSVKEEMVLESGFVSRLVPKWTCRKCGHEWGWSRLPPGAVG